MLTTNYNKYIDYKTTKVKKKKVVKNKASKDMLEKFRRNLIKNQTVAEKRIKSLLVDCAGTFYFQKILYNKSIPMIVDFYCPQRKIVIEVDGKHHYDDKKQFMKDSARDAYFKGIDYRVIRIPNQIAYKITLDELKDLLKKK